MPPETGNELAIYAQIEEAVQRPTTAAREPVNAFQQKSQSVHEGIGWLSKSLSAWKQMSLQRERAITRTYSWQDCIQNLRLSVSAQYHLFQSLLQYVLRRPAEYCWL